MSTNHDVSKLDDLIVTLIDSARGYENAAEHAKDERHRSYFTSMAAERRTVIEALSAQSRALGGSPADYGSAAATLHRRVQDLRTALGGGGEAILAEIERGEDYLREEFDRVLNDERMSAQAMAAVREAYGSVRQGHDRAGALGTALDHAG